MRPRASILSSGGSEWCAGSGGGREVANKYSDGGGVASHHNMLPVYAQSYVGDLESSSRLKVNMMKLYCVQKPRKWSQHVLFCLFKVAAVSLFGKWFPFSLFVFLCLLPFVKNFQRCLYCSCSVVVRIKSNQ